MKKILLTTSIIFSLLMFLPFTVNAGICGDNWTQIQVHLDNAHIEGAINCNGDAGCLTENELAHNVGSTANDIAWAGCCYVVGWLLC